MSINRSMYIGLTGMNANSKALNVIGDNIANMNTVGFKASRSVFQEMLGQSLLGSGGTSSMGGGVGMNSVEKMYEQGALLGTGVSTDMAIAGEGFFALQGEVDGTEGTFFSRDGRFHRDKDGFLVNPQGLNLMGYGANLDGDIGSSLGAIQINDAPIPPKATSKIEMSVNLAANAEEVEAGSFDPNDPGADSAYSTSVKVYDSKGLEHEVQVYFTKEPDGWKYNVVADTSSVESPANPDDAFQVLASGDLAFDPATNKLTGDPILANIKLDTPNGEEMDFSIDLTGTTETGENSSPLNIDQDGSQAGTFQSLTIDKEGTIVGMFSNGEQRTLGQVAVARIKSTHGLRQASGGLVAASGETGTVIFGEPGSGGMGNIYSGALEQSTVDLAAEFTQMILAQRGYQANSRTITTADQVIQEAVNLKR